MSEEKPGTGGGSLRIRIIPEGVGVHSRCFPTQNSQEFRVFPLTFSSRPRWVSGGPRRVRRCRSGTGTAPPRLGLGIAGSNHSLNPSGSPFFLLGIQRGQNSQKNQGKRKEKLTASEVVLHQTPVPLVVAFALVRFLLRGAEKWEF